MFVCLRVETKAHYPESCQEIVSLRVRACLCSGGLSPVAPSPRRSSVSAPRLVSCLMVASCVLLPSSSYFASFFSCFSVCGLPPPVPRSRTRRGTSPKRRDAGSSLSQRGRESPWAPPGRGLRCRGVGRAFNSTRSGLGSALGGLGSTNLGSDRPHPGPLRQNMGSLRQRSGSIRPGLGVCSTRSSLGTTQLGAMLGSIRPNLGLRSRRDQTTTFGSVSASMGSIRPNVIRVDASFGEGWVRIHRNWPGSSPDAES